MSEQGSGGNVLAAICSFFIPGLGQLVQGRLMFALFFFVAWLVSWGLTWILIGWVTLPIIYIWGIIDAAKYRSS